MSITFELNEQYNGIEIKFSDKPTAKVLTQLKKLGFRWHGLKKVWYAKQTDERIEFAKSIEDKMVCEQTSLFEEKKIDPEQPPKKSETKKATKTTKKTTTATTKKATSKKAEPKKTAEVVEFPTQLTFSFGEQNHTIDDLKAKIDEERKTYKSAEHGYVLDGLLKMAETSQDFIDGYMKTSYKQEFEHVTSVARKRAKNGVCCMSADDVLQIICEHVLGAKTKVKEG